MYMMKDYIFVDYRRLDNYVQQIESGPIADKIPVWEFEVSLTGVAASRKQEIQIREPKQQEKIYKFLRYIIDEGILSSSFCTPLKVYYEDKFRLISSNATQVLIPPKAIDGIQLDPLKIWVLEEKETTFIEELRVNSENNRAKVRVILIEDRINPDKREADLLSGFSALQILVNFFEPEWRESELDLRKLNSYGEKQFAKDPVEIFKKAGAHIVGKRLMTAVYRTRLCTFGPDNTTPPFLYIYGYPIIIFQGEISL